MKCMKNVRIKYNVYNRGISFSSLNTVWISLVLVDRLIPNKIFLNLFVTSSTTPTVPVYVGI